MDSTSPQTTGVLNSAQLVYVLFLDPKVMCNVAHLGPVHVPVQSHRSSGRSFCWPCCFNSSFLPVLFLKYGFVRKCRIPPIYSLFHKGWFSTIKKNVIHVIPFFWKNRLFSLSIGMQWWTQSIAEAVSKRFDGLMSRCLSESQVSLHLCALQGTGTFANGLEV